MQKKKVAFVMGTLYMGGAERALINMLKFFDYEHYDVTLWICGEEPGHTELINSNVDAKYLSSEFEVLDDSINGESLKKKIARLFAKIYKSDDEKNMHYFSKSLPKVSNEKYDCVIAYRGWDASILRFAFNRIYANKRIVWMHNDTYITEFPFTYYYKQADRIFCVSKTIKRHLLEKYNGLNGKLEVFYNILDKDDIMKKSEKSCGIKISHPLILSVGRLSWEKNFEIIPETASILKKKGYQFYWYIIGEGYKRRDIEPKINEFDVSDCVILLGEINNPYPYYKSCDIFVQTSITEGYCITTAEAKTFCKPVVTTNLPVMHEQFRNYENGIIANEITPEAIAESVEEYLSDSVLREKITYQLNKEVYDSRQDFKGLYNYINC